jgi:hypothetical protein
VLLSPQPCRDCTAQLAIDDRVQGAKALLSMDAGMHCAKIRRLEVTSLSLVVGEVWHDVG